MHYMRPTGGSVVLVASTSGYFGGTGVSAYVTSKHGVIGLLRSSKKVAEKYGIRVNAVAPFFTPTHITGSYSTQWKEAGLEANTPGDVATVIAQTALDTKRHGTATLVCIS
jgi:NAD(P)-dependent dehydrogenase (short-subunit alcohol dehydrogenase family)